MVTHSSTSSSRRALLALLLAALCVVVADRSLLGVHGPWQRIRNRLNLPGRGLERGVADDRLELRLLHSVELPRAVVVGSSRLGAAFVKAHLRETSEPVHFGLLAHPGIHTFEILSMMDEILSVEPRVVVIGLSEIDLYGDNVVVLQASSGSLRATSVLAAELGLCESFADRQLLLRLALTRAFHSYRYRQVLQVALLDNFRHFPLDGRYPRRETGLVAAWRRPAEAKRVEMGLRSRERFVAAAVAALPGAERRFLERQLVLLRATRAGEHSRFHRTLVTTAVQRLTSAGVEVILVELPTHSLVDRVVDPVLGEEFAAFANGLTKGGGVHFLPLEEIGEFPDQDFNDLLHLDKRSGPSVRMTRTIEAAVYDVLDD